MFCYRIVSTHRQPAPTVGRRPRGDHYQDVAVVVPGRFYGSRVDEQGRSRFGMSFLDQALFVVHIHCFVSDYSWLPSVGNFIGK